jgi:hypothetical protein
VKIVNF